jgi:hypothetical protein
MRADLEDSEEKVRGLRSSLETAYRLGIRLSCSLIHEDGASFAMPRKTKLYAKAQTAEFS